MPTKPKKTKTPLAQKAVEAAGRIGKEATLTRGLLRGTVKVLAYKSSYGRPHYLVEFDGERDWVSEDALEFNNNKPEQEHLHD